MNESRLQVLTVTMNGSIDLYNKLNLNCKSIIANQCDENSMQSNSECCFISTTTKGVGKNRNISLLYSSEDYILFGDDDMQYVDNLEQIIKSEFETHPKVDIFIFNINTTGAENFGRRKNSKYKKVKITNFMNYGAVRIACRRNKIFKKNIWFSLLFGGGTLYGSGEDSIFLCDCLKNKLKIYTCPICIGTVDQSISSWFQGYNEKYLFDKGALMKKMFPTFFRFFCLYFALKLRKQSKMSLLRTYKIMIQGAKSFKKGITYKELKSEA